MVIDSVFVQDEEVLQVNVVPPILDQADFVGVKTTPLIVGPLADTNQAMGRSGVQIILKRI